MLDSRISQSVTLLVEQLNQTLRTLNGQLNRINIRAGGLAGVGIGLIVGLVGVVQDQSGSNASVIHESSDGAGEIAGLTQSAQSRLDVAVLGVVILIVIAGADKDLAILIQQDVLIVGSSIVDPQSGTLGGQLRLISNIQEGIAVILVLLGVPLAAVGVSLLLHLSDDIVLVEGTLVQVAQDQVGSRSAVILGLEGVHSHSAVLGDGFIGVDVVTVLQRLGLDAGGQVDHGLRGASSLAHDHSIGDVAVLVVAVAERNLARAAGRLREQIAYAVIAV